MLKRSLILILLVIVAMRSQAQYMKYDPIPYYPVPDLPLPQTRYYIPPPQPMPSNDNTSAPQTIKTILAIEEALIDNHDATGFYATGQAKIVLYHSHDNLNMAILFMSNNSQSYGTIGIPATIETPASESHYAKTVSTFTWAYKNSYDDKSGQATVILTKVYKVNEVTFTCHILTNTGKDLQFSGHMQR